MWSSRAGGAGSLVENAHFQSVREVDFLQVFGFSFEVDRLDDKRVGVENRLDRAGMIMELAVACGERLGEAAELRVQGVAVPPVAVILVFEAVGGQVELGLVLVGSAGGRAEGGAVAALVAEVADVEHLRLLAEAERLDGLDLPAVVPAHRALLLEVAGLHPVAPVRAVGTDGDADVADVVAVEAATGLLAHFTVGEAPDDDVEIAALGNGDLGQFQAAHPPRRLLLELGRRQVFVDLA